MRTPLRPALALALVLGTAACSVSDFYEQEEYVLHDDTASANGAESDAPDADPGAVGSAEAAATGNGETILAAGIGSDPTDPIARIFVLESLHDELGRAIRDGVGDLEILQQKQQDVAREIQWRKEAAGDVYEAARRERLEQLRQFPIVVK